MGDDDLGDLVGTCDLCNSSLRYQFFVFHPKWGSMEVGTYCCDSLTSTEIASNRIESQKCFDGRKKRFINSKRWKLEGRLQKIKQKGISVIIHQEDKKFRVQMNDAIGKI